MKRTEVENYLEENLPNLGIKIRKELNEGLSEAKVFLIDFLGEKGAQFGILKAGSSASISRELLGYKLLKDSWAKTLIPTRIENLGGPSASGWEILLQTLAKERTDDCLTLTKIFAEASKYGLEIVDAMTLAYANAARDCWNARSVETTLYESFKLCLDVHDYNHEHLWGKLDFPTKDTTLIHFDCTANVFPNPVTYLIETSWKHDLLPLRIPHLEIHGDLNSQNILAPSYSRAFNEGIINNPSKLQLLGKISIIDTPTARIAPFTVDLAFLLNWLFHIKSEFTSKAHQSEFLIAYSSFIGTILGEPITDCSSHFLWSQELGGKVWSQLKQCQPGKIEEIQKSLLISLSGTALRGAIKAAKREKRDHAIRFLAMSSIALGGLEKLGHLCAPNIPNKTTTLSTTIGINSKPWTKAATELSTVILSCRQSRNLVVVLGSEFHSFAGTASNSSSAVSLLKEGSDSWIDKNLKSVRQIGETCVGAIIDYGTSSKIRELVAEGIGSRRLFHLHPNSTSITEFEKGCLGYFQPRGYNEDKGSLRQSMPEFARSKSKYREQLNRFGRTSAPNLTLLLVGLNPLELEDSLSIGYEVWGGSFRSFVLTDAPDVVNDVAIRWGSNVIGGTYSDFFSSVSDYARTESTRNSSPKHEDLDRLLRTLSLARPATDDPSLERRYEVELTPRDYEQINSNGEIFSIGKRFTLDSIEKDPRDFFIGHKATLKEIHNGVPITRECFQVFVGAMLDRLRDSYADTTTIFAQPGSGGSTALIYLGYHLAYEHGIPTIQLRQGLESGYESLRRFSAAIGLPFLVIVDSEDLERDEVQWLARVSITDRIPAHFITTHRLHDVGSSQATVVSGPKGLELPIIKMRLTPHEKNELLFKLGQFVSLSIASKDFASTQSLFFILLEAFGGSLLGLKNRIPSLISELTPEGKIALGAIAFFERYGHRSLSENALSVICSHSWISVSQELLAFDEILLSRDEESWSIHHEELTAVVLQVVINGALRDGGNDWYSLGRFAVTLFERLGSASVALNEIEECVWSVLNPQVNYRMGSEAGPEAYCRLMEGVDSIPSGSGRNEVYEVAADTFWENALIVSHAGKHFSERAKDFAKADKYLFRALELESENPAILHKIGKRYFDELRSIGSETPARHRSDINSQRMRQCFDKSIETFERAFEFDLCREYNYTTALQVIHYAIEDEFRRRNVKSVPPNFEVLTDARVCDLMAKAEEIIALGLRFLPPREEERTRFSMERDKYLRLRGDLDLAIDRFSNHVSSATGRARAVAQVQLVRMLIERGERRWLQGNFVKSSKDFERAEREAKIILDDAGFRGKVVWLWFRAGRHLGGVASQRFLDELHRIHERNPSLDTAFYLMCLYFAEAVNSPSISLVREFDKFQYEVEKRSNLLPIRRFVREWLVRVKHGDQAVVRVFPHHLFSGGEKVVDSEGDGDSIVQRDDDIRIVLEGTIVSAARPTQGSIRIDDVGCEIFFRPHTKTRRFYASDEGKTKVRFFVGFTYEKPIAIDVTPIN